MVDYNRKAQLPYIPERAETRFRATPISGWDVTGRKKT